MKTTRLSLVLLAVSLRSISICQEIGDCGYTFLPEATSGVIQSPNYPFDYRSPASCVYAFLPASVSHVVRICFEFRRFNLHAGASDLDYLEFLSGYRYCERGRLCTTDKEQAAVPLTVWKDDFCWHATDPGKPLQLTFHARSGYSSSGFFAYYKKWPITELGQHQDCKLMSLQHHTVAADPDHRCVIQCPDGSQCDLASQPDCSCPGVVPCEPGQFACFNRKCIPDSSTCDKMDNCGDASDETYMHARCQSRDLLSINFLSCDFELDVCGFLGLSSWKPDSRYYLGPFEDHTVGTGGHYLRTDFTDQKPGTKISFFSQTLKSFPVEGLCLSFWYYSVDDNRSPNDASGEGDDLLVVRFGKTVIWRSNTPKPAWHSAHAYITREGGLHKSQTKLQFEVTRGRGSITLVALDDIVLYKGQCHQVLEPSCTFEQHSCGWVQNDGEDVGVINQTSRWHLHSNTSIGRGSFLYLAIDSSPSTPDYSTLSITSPYVTSALRSDYCVDLRLYTSSDGLLVEIRQQTWPSGERAIWHNRYNATGGWTVVAVTVPGSRVFRIVLGVLSAENGDSVAIDDVTISRGHCYNRSDTIVINSTISAIITASSPTTRVTHVCPPDEHLCHADNVCVKVDKWCDGHRDCPSGEDEHIDLCSVDKGDADSAGSRSVSVLTIMVVASVVFLLVLVLVSLVSFCLMSSLKWRRVPPLTSAAGRFPARADHVTPTGTECTATSGAYAGIPKYRPGSATRTNYDSYRLKPVGISRRMASSIDRTPYPDPSSLLSTGLSGQSRYLEPPPSYSSAVSLGAAYPDGEIPNESQNHEESVYAPSYVTCNADDVTQA